MGSGIWMACGSVLKSDRCENCMPSEDQEAPLQKVCAHTSSSLFSISRISVEKKSMLWVTDKKLQVTAFKCQRSLTTIHLLYQYGPENNPSKFGEGCRSNTQPVYRQT